MHTHNIPGSTPGSRASKHRATTFVLEICHIFFFFETSLGVRVGAKVQNAIIMKTRNLTRPVFFTFETKKFQSHKIRPRPRLKSFGLKRQDQYQDLWYTVLIFETKTALGLKRHSRPLYVKTNDESLADLWWKPICLFGLGLKIKSIIFGIRFRVNLYSWTTFIF